MIKKVVNGEAKTVSRIVKGVKNECRLELDGSENWILYTSSVGWAGVMLADYLPVALRRAAHYSNYFGFTAKNASSRFIWVGVNNKYLFLVWAKGTPPTGYEHWEKESKADIAAIKADLAKKHLIIWYDRTDSSVGGMSALIPLISRDVDKVKKVIDGTAVDVFTHVTSEVAEGVVEVSPAEVTDGVLTLKGDNVKVENNKLIIL